MQLDLSLGLISRIEDALTRVIVFPRTAAEAAQAEEDLREVRLLADRAWQKVLSSTEAPVESRSVID